MCGYFNSLTFDLNLPVTGRDGQEFDPISYTRYIRRELVVSGYHTSERCIVTFTKQGKMASKST